MSDETQKCRDCGKEFPYDPDADYCPECVAENFPQDEGPLGLAAFYSTRSAS